MPAKLRATDSLNPARTIVIGGTSRMGAALRARAPELRSISRHPEPADGLATAVADYRGITPAMLTDADCVLHLVGTTRGTAAELDDANARLARDVASAARQAGVARFIYISSFSVYGACQAIDATTPTNPDSGYGRSKLRAEHLLSELRSANFTPSSIRLPSLYGRVDGKLHQLVTSWAKWRVFPKPSRPVERSFLSYDNAAQLLLNIRETEADEPVAAADSEAFIFEKARQTIAAASERRIRLASIPFAEAAIAAGAPGLYASVFQSSVLASEANAARDLPSTLYRDIGAIAKRAAGLA
jgi:UDP-glucose 4-epimerase